MTLWHHTLGIQHEKRETYLHKEIVNSRGSYDSIQLQLPKKSSIEGGK